MQEILDNDVRLRVLSMPTPKADRSSPLQELRSTAGRVLVACSCLQFPEELARPLMRQLIDLLRTSPSWRTRLDVLLPLQSESTFAA